MRVLRGQIVETQSGKQAYPGSRNGFDDMDERVVFANVRVGQGVKAPPDTLDDMRTDRIADLQPRKAMLLKLAAPQDTHPGKLGL
jgi:hypothetical protein